MAIIDNASHAAGRFSNLPMAQQLGLLVGLAASIALGIWVVLWSKEPIYRPLFNNLPAADSAEVVDVLQQNGFKYKVNKNTGAIMINSADIHKARMKLASDGLPRGSGKGYEMFSNSGSFNTSQFMENARYRHALETELSRTISNFNSIKTARVHLAIPRQSSFVGNKRKPKASVFVDVYSGMRINKNTIASIANLIGSSVPNLSSSDVTVVDQNGQLLNEGSANGLISMTDKFFDYQKQVERSYASKIQDILEPILGHGKIKAKVSADIDFTSSEQTREVYNPDLPALRSEQLMSEQKAVGEKRGGIVGATSNQPAQEGELQAQNASVNSNVSAGGQDHRRQSTKNYELDKTISHTSQRAGRIERLTVAVLVDDKHTYDDKKGTMIITPLTEVELTKIKQLVSDTVGLELKRGDSLNVVNVRFNTPEPIEALPELAIYQQDWFWEIMKQSLGGLFVLFLVFGILRPTFKSLASTDKRLLAALKNNKEGHSKETKELNTPEARIEAAKEFAGSNPKGVAEVLKTWVDGG